MFDFSWQSSFPVKTESETQKERGAKKKRGLKDDPTMETIDTSPNHQAPPSFPLLLPISTSSFFFSSSLLNVIILFIFVFITGSVFRKPLILHSILRFGRDFHR